MCFFSPKARYENSFFIILNFIKRKKNHAQPSWAWKKFYNLGAGFTKPLFYYPVLTVSNLADLVINLLR